MCVVEVMLLVLCEFRLCCYFECGGFGCDDMFEWFVLLFREDCGIDFFGDGWVIV